MKVLALILSLSLLVITHEFGHLGFAKLFHTRVRRFYLFFNWKFSLFKAKKFDGKWHFLFFNAETPQEWEEKEPDNTLWGIGWIPLGGYCDIAGMIDETKSSEDMESEPQPWEYRSKKAWQRLCIISGGVLVNFISALLIYTCIFAHWGQDELPLHNAELGYEYHQILLDEGFENGDILYAIDGVEQNDFAEAQTKLILSSPKKVTVLRHYKDSLGWPDSTGYVELSMSGKLIEHLNEEQPKTIMAPIAPFVVKDFVAGSPAKKAGMLADDRVVAINGEPMESYPAISGKLAECKGTPVAISFYRGEQLQEVQIDLPSDGKIGVQLKSPIEVYEVSHTDYTFFQAIPAGISFGCNYLANYVKSLGILFHKGGAQNLGGFGTLGSLFPEEWNWQSFWNITAMLALILAFMNIIPIPGLDGGHIVFTLWEMITRRKPSEKFLEYAQNVGMILLLLLMVLANGNDLWRWIRGMF